MHNQIGAWLDRIHPLPRRFHLPSARYSTAEHWLTFVTLEEVVPLHRADEVPWISLRDSAKIADKFVREALAILGPSQVTEPMDKAEVMEKLGHPPPQALPIYFITVGGGESERLVYVGKTKTDTRFSGGHLAALKLHDPAFAELRKQIYRCTVTNSVEHDWVALEWLDPVSTAESILDDVESQLIYEFKPVLNRRKKDRKCARRPIAIHIQNAINHGPGAFLNDVTIDP